MLPADLTVADSLTAAPTSAVAGLADTWVVVACRLAACADAVAAPAGIAHNAQATTATAVTDTKRTTLTPMR